jgi:cold shock CspA family protein
MAKGTVKFFAEEKGWGSISGGGDNVTMDFEGIQARGVGGGGGGEEIWPDQYGRIELSNLVVRNLRQGTTGGGGGIPGATGERSSPQRHRHKGKKIMQNKMKQVRMSEKVAINFAEYKD